MTRLIIDTDPGVDDAHAIMLAYGQAAKGVKVEALTVVAGNVGLDRTTANARTVLDVLGIAPDQTPIYAGADRALLGHTPDAANVHGADGLGDSNYPPSHRRLENEHAALALIRMANESPGELTLAAIGPLTNLALATRLDPALPGKFKRLVVMGGAIRGTGNMSRPTTEFNIYSDPEAAAIVFAEWPGLWLVSWETTMAYMLTRERLDELMSAGTPKSEFFRRITEQVVAFVTAKLGRPGLFAPDPLALAVAIDPTIVNRSELRAVSVELAGTYTRGETSVDWFGLTGATPNVNLVLEVDFERFWSMMVAAVK